MDVSALERRLLEDKRLGLCLPETLPGTPGVTVEACDLRAVPTLRPRLKGGVDENQLARLHLGEGLCICDRLAGWYRVRSYAHSGWVQARQVALGRWPDPFRTPGAAAVCPCALADGTAVVPGTCLPLEGGKLLRPLRGRDGRLEFGRLPLADGFCPGFLPAVPESALLVAQRLLGTPYGWGGQKGLDSAALVCDVFRAMGIRLPGDAARLLLLPDAPVPPQEAACGMLLVTSGHAMLVSRARPLAVIHALSACRGADGSLRSVNCVTQSDPAAVFTASGRSLLQQVRGVKALLPVDGSDGFM